MKRVKGVFKLVINFIYQLIYFFNIYNYFLKDATNRLLESGLNTKGRTKQNFVAQQGIHLTIVLISSSFILYF